jgi:cobalt-zinc-cadmium resistance protein CzcA
MLVATLGLFHAAMSRDIGSDLQRSFAIVIVGGLIVELIVSLVMMPTLYVFWAPSPVQQCGGRARRLALH